MLSLSHALDLVTSRIRRAMREQHPAGVPGKRKASSIAHRRVSQLIVLALALAFGYSAAQAQSLSAPTTLSATTYSKTQINLVWSDPNPAPSGISESGYLVERAKGTSTSWSKVFTSGPNVTSWSSTGLSNSTIYSYRVRAFAVVGGVTVYSGYSPVASATTLSSLYPTQPANLTATALSLNQIALKWQDKSNNEVGFEVQRAPSSSGPWGTVGTTGAGKVSYTDSGLTPATSYAYRVLAYNSTGESASSNVVTTTTKPDTTLPTVSIASPAAGTVYTVAQPVAIMASASDNVGVSLVEFYDGVTLMGMATTSPYTYTWLVTSADNGLHSWTAKVYDTSNNSSTSGAVGVTVDIALLDTTAPTPGPVTASGSQFGGFVSSPALPAP